LPPDLLRGPRGLHCGGAEGVGHDRDDAQRRQAAGPGFCATALTDADCTQANDLAGIYFAGQASYEQQVLDANQQALNAAVRQ
jgi:hypothetical protein